MLNARIRGFSRPSNRGRIDGRARIRNHRGMIRALTLSIGQLADPPILRVLAKSLALTLLIFVGLGVLLQLGLGALAGWSGIAALHGGLATAAAVLVAILLGILLFRVVAIAVIGLFGDEIVGAVERRHYPAAARVARPVGLARSLAMGSRSAIRALLFNLAAVPLYILLLVTGVGSVALFLAVNALLLGRDLGEMVAARHMERAALAEWLAATRVERALTGLVVAGLFVIPVANLFAPILGAAMATHRFHGGLK